MKKLYFVLLVALLGCESPPPGVCEPRIVARPTTRERHWSGDTVWVNHKTDTTWVCGRIAP